jgi:hypothetical protein
MKSLGTRPLGTSSFFPHSLQHRLRAPPPALYKALRQRTMLSSPCIDASTFVTSAVSWMLLLLGDFCISSFDSYSLHNMQAGKQKEHAASQEPTHAWPPPRVTLSAEGNISVGKSTFLNHLTSSSTMEGMLQVRADKRYVMCLARSCADTHKACLRGCY